MKLTKAQREIAAMTGKEGGKVRAKKLSKQRRIEIAKAAAQARWRKDGTK
jgi:hypothetical protein